MKFDVAELIQRAGKTRQPELVLPPIIPPAGLERDLLNLYLRVVRGWGTEVYEKIMPEYRATIAEGVRDAPADVQETVDESSATMTRLVVELGPHIENWVVRTEEWHRGRFVQQFTPAGVNLNTMLGRGDVSKTMESVLSENLALIRSLNEQMRNGISGAVFRGLTNRTPAAEVAREIRKLTGVGRSRAELIAADQLQKLTGRLDQERQEQLGMTEFQWAHSHKKHPRPEHVARDGLKFKWDSPVGKNDPPGRAIRCGCRARAVVTVDPEAAAEQEAQAPEPPPPPAPRPEPEPKRAGFQSPIDKSLTAETVRVSSRLGMTREMAPEFAEAMTHKAYQIPGEFSSRKATDYGKAQLGAAFTDEAASMVRALKPELDNLADQIGIPRLRAFKTTNGSSIANQGDGIMALNPSYFNAYAGKVGGPGGLDEIAKLEAQREAIKLQMQPLRERLQAIKAEVEKVAFGSPERQKLMAEYYDVLRPFTKLRDKDDALWAKIRKAQTATKSAGREAVKWKPGELPSDRPYNAVNYYGEGIDQARAVLFHEFGHHVHQYWGKEGHRRQFGKPPLERELQAAYRKAMADGGRDRQLSQYATSNEFEWWAENFSAYVMGRLDLVDPIAREMIERLFNGTP